jgi:hypothetical protein
MSAFVLFAGAAACILAAAYFLRGSVSLRSRDEYAAKDYQSENYFYQSFQNWHNGP